MHRLLIIITTLLVLAIVISFYRVVRGPTLFDRLLAAGAMGSKTVGLICLFGLLYGRLSMFIDIALAYGVLNFIGSIAVAKYVQLREAKT